MPAKKPPGRKKSILVISYLPGTVRADPATDDTADKKAVRFRPGERKEFQRFQKRAKKVGLLVSQDSYKLYFRNHRVESG
jgi:hypothetical protein